MKRFLILTVLLLFMIGCVGCNNQTPPDVTDPITDPTADPSTTTDPSMYENNARIYVNGVELFSERKYYNEELKEYELPFLAIMKGLGFTVDWRSDEEVFIVSEDVTYILNPTEGTIIDPASPERGSLFFEPPGGSSDNFQFSFSNQEFLIDKNMAIGFFPLGMGYSCGEIEATIDFYPETREIYITRLYIDRVIFPTDPNDFNPLDLDKFTVNDPEKGMVISWKQKEYYSDPKIIFQWVENKNNPEGAYYLTGDIDMGVRYKPGVDLVPIKFSGWFNLQWHR